MLVRKDGRDVFVRGYGVRDLRSMAKIDAHTNFRLASCTKQFTAMAIMLLVHDGKLRYDEPLTEVFPGFPCLRQNDHDSPSAESRVGTRRLRIADGAAGTQRRRSLERAESDSGR